MPSPAGKGDRKAVDEEKPQHTMSDLYNKKYVSTARALRKNMTPEEKHLWYDFFKKIPLTVNRQKNIGDFIVDFFIAGKRIVIEIDGSQHDMPENKKADEKRDADLRKAGMTVLRYTNSDIHNRFRAVCEDIIDHLGLCACDIKE